MVATVYPQQRHRAEAIAVLEQAIPRVHGEDGCELYALHEAEDRLVMVEKWASRSALEAHLQGAVFQEMSGQLAPLTAQRADVQVLTPHPAGAERQGRVGA